MAQLDVAEATPAAAAIDVGECPPVLALLLDSVGSSAYWRGIWPLDALRLREHCAAYAQTGVAIPEADALLDWPEFRPRVLLLPRFQPSTRPRGAAPAWCARLRAAGVRLIYDLDDDLVTPVTGTEVQGWAALAAQIPGRSSLTVERIGQGVHQAVAGLQLCDGVTVATERLATVVRRRVRPDVPVVVVPNAIDPTPYLRARQWAAAQAQGGTTVTVGWAGSPRLDADFLDTGLAEAWSRLARRSPALRFKVVGGRPEPLLAAVPPERLTVAPPVPFGQWPNALMGIDVACCALTDVGFNRAKSPQKAWEHILTGAAVVASPTVYGDDPGYAKHGGLLASNVDEWEAHLSRLIESAEERRARADALASWVVAEHTLEANLWHWPAAWRTIADQAARRPAVSLGHGGGQAAAQRARQKAKAKAKRRR